MRFLPFFALFAGLLAAFVAGCVGFLSPGPSRPPPPSITTSDYQLAIGPPAGDDVAFTLFVALRNVPSGGTIPLHFSGAPLTEVTAESAFLKPLAVRVLDGGSRVEVVADSMESQGGGGSVRLRFHQRQLATAYAWGYRVARIPWSGDFGVGTEYEASEDVEVKLPPGWPTLDFECEPQIRDYPRDCRLVREAMFPVRMVLGPRDERLATVVFAALLASSAAVFAAAARRAWRRLRAQKGIARELPPDPTAAQGTYRQGAAALRPPEIVVPPLVRAGFVARTAVLAVAVVASTAIAARLFAGLSPWPMPYVLAAWGGAALVLSAAILLWETPRALLPVATCGILAIGLLAPDGGWRLVGALAPFGLAGIFESVAGVVRLATSRR